MPRLLAVGHVTRDLLAGEELLGGSVAYGALAALRLGWEAAVLTSAGPDFEPERELAGIPVFWRAAAETTRFRNDYRADGTRVQSVLARAEDIDLSLLPDEWRAPEALLIGPVAGEIHGALTPAFNASVVGAIAQGWLREIDDDGQVSARAWVDPGTDLSGVHVLFFSEHDLPDAIVQARAFRRLAPVVVVTQGWRGLRLLADGEDLTLPGLPRPEVDPTGAGDVFATAFLIRYHETEDLRAAAAFAACAASCVVEGPGTTALGDRTEVERRLELLTRLIEDGEWEE
jgi:sugar/nucleoside kinase (ribokinase family)